MIEDRRALADALANEYEGGTLKECVTASPPPKTRSRPLTAHCAAKRMFSPTNSRNPKDAVTGYCPNSSARSVCDVTGRRRDRSTPTGFVGMRRAEKFLNVCIHQVKPHISVKLLASLI